MALVISTDLELVNVQAFGNYFTFKPGQMKNMDPRIADFLSRDKKAYGFVKLPEVCEEEPGSEAAKTAIELAIVEGRDNIKAHLQSLIHNLEVSLQAEYERIKESVPKSVTAAHLPHYKKLAALNVANVDKSEAAIAEIEKLKGQINGTAPAANTVASTKGN